MRNLTIALKKINRKNNKCMAHDQHINRKSITKVSLRFCTGGEEINEPVQITSSQLGYGLLLKK